MADQNLLKEGETLEPRIQQKAASVAAPSHPALKAGEELQPRNTTPPVAPNSEDTDKTWGSFAGIPYKKSSFDPGHMATEAGHGLMEMGTGIAHTATDLINPNVSHDEFVKKYVTDPSDAEFKKGGEDLARGNSVGNWTSALGHGLAGEIPIIGPYAASLGEQAGTGDVGGAIAKGGTQALAGYYTPKFVGGALKVAKAVPTIYGAAKALPAIAESMPKIQSGIESLKTLGDVHDNINTGIDDLTGPMPTGFATKDMVAKAPPITAAPTIPKPVEAAPQPPITAAPTLKDILNPEAPEVGPKTKLQTEVPDSKVRSMIHNVGEDVWNASGKDPVKLKALHDLKAPDLDRAWQASGEKPLQHGYSGGKYSWAGTGETGQSVLNKMLAKGKSIDWILENAKSKK